MSKVEATPSEMFFRRETKNPLPSMPKKLDLETAMAKKDNKEIYSRRKIHPSKPLYVGQRVDVQNMKTKQWDRQATIQRIREGGESFWICFDNEDENVLRNRRYLRAIKESSSTHGAPGVTRSNMEDHHVDEPEIHLTESNTQAEQRRSVGSSPRAPTEDLWWPGKETEEQRSVASPAQRGTQARPGSPPEVPRPGSQAARQKSHTSHTTQSRYNTRANKKRVIFNLERNTYIPVDQIDKKWGLQNQRRK